MLSGVDGSVSTRCASITRDDIGKVDNGQLLNARYTIQDD